MVPQQHPAVLCPTSTTLDKSDDFSENIRMRKDEASELSLSPNRTMANETAARTSPGGKTSVTPRRVPGTMPQPGQDCEVKVSVQDSNGSSGNKRHFVEAKFYNSRVIDFDGDYMHLDVKNTSVSNMVFKWQDYRDGRFQKLSISVN
ncbi:hypothetical protein GWK47_052397 [Chionoecetes opilio]|uniref:Uncharacterized protein n=1 Tax=Chionoecetes opilio TaxID=41210 RepID=A0A8J5CRT3_CHIOP|nr:hypothetical protein GWK47_052397 [Chionoecetes opilio]